MPRIVCISDTHDRLGRIAVPDGDILVHAGDLTGRGRPEEVRAFTDELATLPHRHKIVIAGNHDFLFERDPARAQALLDGCIYLQDAAVEILGLRFWGSPWQPWFYDWAFNLPRGEAIAAKWALIPPGTDVLVTHGPPRGILDRTAGGDLAGCEDLLLAVRRLRPRLHVFGHIHEAWGREERDGTLFVNASICDLGYAPIQAPIVVDLD